MSKIDNDTAKKVMDILSNPEMLQKISAIASGKPPEPVISTPSVPLEATPQKADLLLAIKPFLKAEKQSKVDTVIKALTVAAAVSRMKGGGKTIV